MGKIRLNIPTKNAKTIEVDGKEYIVPKITLYHRKYFKNIDEIRDENVYNIVNPVVKKIFRVNEDFDNKTFEYLIIKLFEHNDLLIKNVSIDNELFKLEDIVLNQSSTFEYDDVEYKFGTPMVHNSYTSLMDGMNKLQKGTDHNFEEFPPIFYKFALNLFGTVEVEGDRGNKIRGLNNILDTFINSEAFDKFRSA